MRAKFIRISDGSLAVQIMPETDDERLIAEGFVRGTSQLRMLNFGSQGGVFESFLIGRRCISDPLAPLDEGV